MPRETETIKLLKTLLGSYTPRGEEARRLAELARLNKLLLAYLRRVGGSLRDELLREEARCRWFRRNAAEVVEVLEDVGAAYALYKFRRPLDHVSVDLDVLVSVEDVPRAVKALASRGFKVVVREPYTVTLARNGFIVDLYTHPSFAWVVYMDGEKLLKCCVEEVEVDGLRARALSREAEVAVSAAHAIYKEHTVLLMDCLVAWAWTNRGASSLASELGAGRALEALRSVCRAIGAGRVEAPCKLGPDVVAKVLAGKLVEDSTFRATAINALKYVFGRGDVGARMLSRFLRRSY
jgi:hypothetical protein